MKERPSIPLHKPAADQHATVWTERIAPLRGAVRNSVHRHSYHEIFLFTKGEGMHMIDLEVFSFKAPCMHLVGPGQVHQLERSAGSEGAVIMFRDDLQWLDPTDPLIRPVLRGNVAPRSFPLMDQEIDQAMDLFHRIENEQDPISEVAARIKEHYLGILLLRSISWSKEAATADADRKGGQVDRFMEMVDRDFLENKKIASYASALSISPGHLNELVKKRTGKSASEILHDRILLEAKRLLLHSSLTVKEVSFALRMEDPAYFTRMFRKATGSTPLEYRNSIREKYRS